jgi:hypothetical protein
VTRHAVAGAAGAPRAGGAATSVMRERLLAALRQHVPDYWQDHEQFRLTIESAADVVVRARVWRRIAATSDAARRRSPCSTRERLCRSRPTA